MKITRRILSSLFSLFVIAHPLLFAQAPPPIPSEPCLRVVGGPVESMNCQDAVVSPNPYPLPANINRVTLRLSDNPTTLETTNPLARYKAFWIFGDGNFAEYPHREMAEDLSTYTQPYNYHTSGDFTALVVLAEKKSDKDPPGVQRRTINVPVEPAPNSGTQFKRMLQDNNKTLDIFNSELMRPRHHTAFALSAPTIKSTQAFFFFFNARTSGEGATPDGSLFNLIPADVVLPKYFSGGTNVVEVRQGLVSNITSETFIINGAAQALLENTYNNYVMVRIFNNDQVFSNLPAEFDEIRFFPILKTVLENGTLPTTRFASIVVGGAPPSENLSPFFTSARIQNLQGQLGLLFPNSPIDSTFVVGSFTDPDGPVFNYYVTGAEVKDIQMVGSIDPNMLEVKEICPAENGSYKVKLRLEVCNKGYIGVNDFDVRIIDKDNLFSKEFAFEGTVSATPLPVADQPIGSGHQWFFTWNTFLGEVHLPGAEVPESDIQPTCQELFFTVEAKDWTSVQRLVAGNGLEACINFHNDAPEECHFNLAIDSTKVTNESGYNCGTTTTPSTCPCDLVCMVLLFVALLLAFLAYWKKKIQN